MDDVVYVVSGYMRTGTSMMMRALEVGGLTPAFDSGRDEMNETYGDEDYQPNPAGFYELTKKEFQDPKFPTMYMGKLVKCLFGGLAKFPVSSYKIVFMKRDPEEIRQSFDAFFESVPEGQRQNVSRFLKTYPEVMDDQVARLKNRIDTHTTVLQYREVVEDPIRAYEHLVERGWPIDPIKAAETVNPELCRFRIENLTVGI